MKKQILFVLIVISSIFCPVKCVTVYNDPEYQKTSGYQKQHPYETPRSALLSREFSRQDDRPGFKRFVNREPAGEEYSAQEVVDYRTGRDFPRDQRIGQGPDYVYAGARPRGDRASEGYRQSTYNRFGFSRNPNWEKGGIEYPRD